MQDGRLASERNGLARFVCTFTDISNLAAACLL